MPTRNDVTGDTIQSKGPSKKYMDNYDAIFGKKKKDQKSVQREVTDLNHDGHEDAPDEENA